MITVRPATRGDLAFLAETEKICFSDPWSEGIVGQQLSSPCGVSLIAERDGVPAGCFAGALILPEAEVLRVGVLPEQRGAGVGQALVRAFLSQNPGVETCFLEVRASNAPALGLYRKCGFGQVGVRRGYYAAPKEDALIMKWERKNEGADTGI